MGNKKKNNNNNNSSTPKGHIPNPPSGLNKKQNQFINAINQKDMVIATGDAGVGKTYISAAYAGYFYLLGKANKIVLTRPTVSTGKSIGFFPGSLDEKMQPWTKPFIDVLEGYLTKGKVETMMKNEQLEIVPFETIRGRSFDDAFIILDEAQNTSQTEIQAFVTRQGENTTTIINGDLHQSDMNGSGNGLELIVSMVKGSPSLQEKVSLIEFSADDVVRSELCRRWIQEFENLS